MKKLSIVLLIIILIVILLHVALFAFVNTIGKDIIALTIKKNLGANASIDSLSVKFPFTIEVRNFVCPNIAIKKLDVLPSIFNPFKPKIVLNRVQVNGLTARVIQEKKEDVLDGFPLQHKTKDEEKEPKKETVDKPTLVTEEPAPKKPVQKKLPLEFTQAKTIPIYIRNIYIRDSSVEVSYYRKDKPIEIIFEDIVGRVKNFSFPQLTNFHTNLNASLRTKRGVAKNSISIKGWINYAKRDMDVDLKLDAIDYFLFSDFYPRFWKPKSLGIKEAYLSLVSNFNSKSNDLTINSTLSADKVSYVEDSKDTSRRDTLRTILALLQGGADKPRFNFILKTKMDMPALDFSSVGKEFKTSIPLTPTLIVNEAVYRAEEILDEVGGEVLGEENITVDKAIDAIVDIGDKLIEIFDPEEQNLQPTNNSTN